MSTSSSIEPLNQDLENLSLSTNLETQNPDTSSSSPDEAGEDEEIIHSTLQHFLHDHLLFLFSCPSDWDDKDETCNICGQIYVADGLLYGCEDEECDFMIHQSCAVLPKQITGKLHPEHPLELSIAERFEKKSCIVCDKSLSCGHIYSCDSCKFSVHAHCAEFPKYVRNMLHPEHLLEFSKSNFFRCGACGEDCFSSSNYKCTRPTCGFTAIDKKCALELTFEEPQGHSEHTFKIKKPSLFSCDACGPEEKSKGISYVCTVCQIQVHGNCSSFPLTIKAPRHKHILKLTYSFQIDSYKFRIQNKICKICFDKINDVLCFYWCAECAYITHVKCGVSSSSSSASVPGVEHEEIINPMTAIRSIDEVPHQEEQQIDHFSHPHPLFLKIDEPEGDIMCDGCIRPISVPFYACDDDQCNFFLHQHCVALPKTTQHPLHYHDLTLITTWDRDIAVEEFTTRKGVLGFLCYGCNFYCNGLIYACEACCDDFFLDVGCSLLPDNLQHEGHLCEAFTLIDALTGHSSTFADILECSACGVKCSNKFFCEDDYYDFLLDLQCASLPKMIPHECPKHGWNKHPFKLTYHAIEDGSGVYYCDECEERRDENHWFYYCEDCKYSAHPSCLLGYHRTKYGRSYEIREHPHPVRLLKKPRGDNWNDKYCTTCLKPLEKNVPVLSCKECNIYFHSLGDCCTFVKTDLE